jgi:hypothetical protein
MCNVVSIMAALLLPLWLDGARCLRHVAMRHPLRHAGAQDLAQSVQSTLAQGIPHRGGLQGFFTGLKTTSLLLCQPR